MGGFAVCPINTLYQQFKISLTRFRFSSTLLDRNKHAAATSCRSDQSGFCECDARAVGSSERHKVVSTTINEQRASKPIPFTRRRSFPIQFHSIPLHPILIEIVAYSERTNRHANSLATHSLRDKIGSSELKQQTHISVVVFE